ncbi:DUF427 domain-containing protein [Geodermatophilus sp. SYSU D00691]
MRDYPRAMTPVGHVEPVPRRIRAWLGGTPVLDTTAARYVWEWPYYPQFYVPLADVAAGVLEDEGVVERRRLGTARRYGVRAGGQHRPGAAWVPAEGELSDCVHVDWAALDAWFEEDEQVFVHPRNPYSRVDALRSTRTVRVELDGVLLAESSSPVLVFETGLPTRYYLPRTALQLDALEPSDTVTECPYKGRTSAYWSVRIGDRLHRDLAWSYDFPTRQLLPIAGLVAFYNEKVDLVVDGRPLDRPRTHFS